MSGASPPPASGASSPFTWSTRSSRATFPIRSPTNVLAQSPGLASAGSSFGHADSAAASEATARGEARRGKVRRTRARTSEAVYVVLLRVVVNEDVAVLVLLHD